MPKAKDTANQLLDAAQALVQTRGFNGFSYRDLAGQIGIRTASIHYHFPSKADLGLALVTRYHQELEQALLRIERKGKSEEARLKAFIRLYRETETAGSICLCGSLAADRATLAEPVQEAVLAYLAKSEAWVAARISAGVDAGEFGYAGKAADAAASLVSSLQGGLILARATPDRTLINTVQRVFFQTLESN